MCRFVLDAKHLRTGDVLATVALRLVLTGSSWLQECGSDLLNISIIQFCLSNLEVTAQSAWVCFMHKMFAPFTVPLRTLISHLRTLSINGDYSWKTCIATFV